MSEDRRKSSYTDTIPRTPAIKVNLTFNTLVIKFLKQFIENDLLFNIDFMIYKPRLNYDIAIFGFLKAVQIYNRREDLRKKYAFPFISQQYISFQIVYIVAIRILFFRFAIYLLNGVSFKQ